MTSNMSETIGFIGLGNMGVPMAGRLIDGGYSPGRQRHSTGGGAPARGPRGHVGRLARRGRGRRADRHHDPADLARGAGGAAGGQGLLDALRPGSLVLE